MTVSDNGRGFDVERETLGKSGHYECVGIRERCGKIGAEVAWHSAPGEGSAIRVTLPLHHTAPPEPTLAAAGAGFER